MQASHAEQFGVALRGDFVPRNPAGVPVSEAGKMGTPLLQWAELWIKRIFIDGREFVIADEETGGGSSAIISGATSAASRQPKYLKASGSTNAATILAATTPLALTINGSAATYSTDVSIVGLTVAPATNNTCLVNNGALSGQADTRYLQEIAIDTVGSEITALNGTIAAFKLSTEVFLAFVDTTNGKLKILQRGFFFDSANAPLSRVTVTDNAVITLLKLSYIFADGSAPAVTFTSGRVTYSGAAPGTPTAGDYWLDTTVEQWKRYSGSVWQGAPEVNRLLIGYAVCDASNCIAARALDFDLAYDSQNSFSLEKISNTQLRSRRQTNLVNVYGNTIAFNTAQIWDITANLDAGLTEASSTRYFFYVKQNGALVISDVAPNYFIERRGGYHPFETWRFVGSAVNDGSGNLGAAVNYLPGDVVTLTSTGAVLNPHGLTYDLLLVGGGGGGGSGAAGGGNTTAAYTDATAGGGGTPGGGSASGGLLAKTGVTGAATAGGVPGLGGAVAERIANFQFFYSYAPQPATASAPGAGPGNGGNAQNILSDVGGGSAGGVYDKIDTRTHGFAFVGSAGTGTSGADGGTGTAIARFLGA